MLVYYSTSSRKVIVARERLVWFIFGEGRKRYFEVVRGSWLLMTNNIRGLMTRGEGGGLTTRRGWG
jgi:hypothetical protein